MQTPGPWGQSCLPSSLSFTPQTTTRDKDQCAGCGFEKGQGNGDPFPFRGSVWILWRSTRIFECTLTINWTGLRTLKLHKKGQDASKLCSILGNVSHPLMMSWSNAGAHSVKDSFHRGAQRSTIGSRSCLYPSDFLSHTLSVTNSESTDWPIDLFFPPVYRISVQVTSCAISTHPVLSFSFLCNIAQQSTVLV